MKFFDVLELLRFCSPSLEDAGDWPEITDPEGTLEFPLPLPLPWLVRTIFNGGTFAKKSQSYLALPFSSTVIWQLMFSTLSPVESELFLELSSSFSESEWSRLEGLRGLLVTDNGLFRSAAAKDLKFMEVNDERMEATLKNVPLRGIGKNTLPWLGSTHFWR